MPQRNVWFRASLIYINNCQTKCNTKQSIYQSASSLYMFRVSNTHIIRSTQNCNYSLRYCAATSLKYGQAWPRWREVKCKAVPLQAWSGPEGSRKLRFPDYMTTAQDGGKIVSLTHRPPLRPGNAPGTHFCKRLSRPQGHGAIGRIMSMKNSNGWREVAAQKI